MFESILTVVMAGVIAFISLWMFDKVTGKSTLGWLQFQAMKIYGWIHNGLEGLYARGAASFRRDETPCDSPDCPQRDTRETAGPEVAPAQA